MSYSDALKDGILRSEPKKICCSRAFLLGILTGADVLLKSGEDGKEEEPKLLFRTELPSLSAAVSRLVRLRFGKEMTEETVSRPGHKVYLSTVSSKPLFRFLNDLEAGFPKEEIPAVLSLKCPDCKASYFRGLFLGCGSMSEPKGSGYHLEFRVPSQRGDSVRMLLSGFSDEPLVCDRRGKTGLYYKKGSAIGDFFSAIGENQLYFSLLNLQIERQIRAGENRATNCVARNIGKTVDAAVRQVNAVRRLCESGELEKLSPELRETARLRIEYDDDSLSALAERHNPALTKSGLSHRLQKLVELSEELCPPNAGTSDS